VEEIAQARGLSLAAHRSRPVTAQLLRQFPLIVTMEQGQKEALQAEFSEIAGRVYRLSELVGGVHDVRDPVGGDRAQFEAVAQELAALLEQAAPRLVRLARVD
jgi:protein-tyrosine phosphatase